MASATERCEQGVGAPNRPCGPFPSPRYGDLSRALCSASQQPIARHPTPGAAGTTMLLSTRCHKGEPPHDMKTIVSTLIALSVLAGIAGSAGALDAKTFYEQHVRAQH